MGCSSKLELTHSSQEISERKFLRSLFPEESESSRANNRCTYLLFPIVRPCFDILFLTLHCAPSPGEQLRSRTATLATA